MRNKLFVVCLAVAGWLVPPPAHAQTDVAAIGDFITYGGLVEMPDFTIQYISYVPEALTLRIAPRVGVTAIPNEPSVELKKGVGRDIYLKKECTGGANFTPVFCRSYVVRLTWPVGDIAAGSSRKVYIEYELRIIPAKDS